jgi:predicted dehydrogenase
MLTPALAPEVTGKFKQRPKNLHKFRKDGKAVAGKLLYDARTLPHSVRMHSSSPLRVGLIGAGSIAGAHLKAYQAFPQKVQLVGICDVNRAAAETRSREMGGIPAFTDVHALLAATNCEAVDICTVHDQHAPNTMAALAAGRHVLVEKPFGVSMAECREMVTAAERARRTLMVAQCQRYDASYAAIRDLVKADKLGRVHAARFDAMQNLAAFVPSTHWLFDGRRAGGGIVISVLVHKIDLLRYVLGEVRLVSAACRTTKPIFTNGAEDYVTALMEFENGAIADVFATYSGYRMPYGENFMLLGEHGAVHALPSVGRYIGPAYAVTADQPAPTGDWDTVHHSGFNPIEPRWDEFPTRDSITNEILHFADCVQTGREPLSSGRDNLGTMAVVFALYESARNGGQPVAPARFLQS